MDSLEFNKIAGSVLATLLVIVVIGYVGDFLVSGEELEESVVVIDVPESDTPVVTDEAPPPAEESVLALLADADVAAGEDFAGRCGACHSFDRGGANGVGPNLWGVVGRDYAAAEGYSYSSAMAEAGGSWTWEALDAFLASPKDAVPGTKMGFAGVRRVGQRADLIAWLRTLSDSPLALPVMAEEAAMTQAAEEQAAAEQAAAAEAAAAAAEEAAEEAAEAAMVEEAEAAAAEAEAEAAAAEAAAEAAAAEAAAAEEAAAEAAYAAAEAATAEGAAAEQAAAEAAAAEAAAVEEETAEAAAEAAATEAAAAEEAAAQAEAEAAAAEEAAAEEAAVEAAEAETAATEEADGVGARLAAADAGAGQRLARRCGACHTFDEGGANRVGPNLWDVVGRDTASAEGYNYSAAMSAKGGGWSYEALDTFLADPRGTVPGTRMSFAGIADAADRASLILWLRSLSGAPVALPGE